MKICGLQKTTLLDYPGHVAATIFLGGCNFRCPFCHNWNLMFPEQEDLLDEADIFSFLKKRTGVLEGVCITGGEPTLQDELNVFIKKIKNLGYRVKLDTNGYRPRILKELCREGLVDYVAMDIKNSLSAYHGAAGVTGLDLDRIRESVQFLLKGTVDYEFRTTVVRELHSVQNFEEIGQWLKGCCRYYLQNFKDSESVPVRGYHGCTKEELKEFMRILKPDIPNVSLRGID